MVLNKIEVLRVIYLFSSSRMTIVASCNTFVTSSKIDSDVISRTINRASETCGRFMKIVVLVVILDWLYCVRNYIPYILSRRTVFVLSRVLFWCLFSTGNKHTKPSRETVPHSITYINLYIIISFKIDWSDSGRLQTPWYFASHGFILSRPWTLRWRHNRLDGVSNHQPHHCLLSRLFGRGPKKTSKLRVTGHCVGNSPGTGEFPAQMASNAENVSIWWRHHD